MYLKATSKAVFEKADETVNSKTLSEVPHYSREAYNAKSYSKSTSSITSMQHKDLVLWFIEATLLVTEKLCT